MRWAARMVAGDCAFDVDAALRALVRTRLPELVDRVEDAGRYMPRFVRRYLERYAGCGDPSGGFALLRCDCGRARVVPFRCHARALCPTCGGRQMSAGAAHLVDRVFPRLPVRQWVLTVPWPRRYLLARRADLCAAVRARVWRRLSRWYADRARGLGVVDGQTGAVFVVQRFSSSLALNVHFHMLVLDGVYAVPSDGGEPAWTPVPPPSTEEVATLVAELAAGLERWFAKQGYGQDEGEAEDPDDQDALLAASVAGRVAHGVRAGHRVRRLRGGVERGYRLPPRCAEHGGYNLHAGVVVGAHDRGGLERLSRYVLRPPMARSRLSRRADGLWVLTLRRAWGDGTQALVYSELELLEKLAALVPPAFKNGVTYHGVLAPRHALRARVVPEPPVAARGPVLRKRADPPRKPRWHPWHDLLWRVFGVDGLACGCGGQLVLHAVVLPPATLDVLASLRRTGALDPVPRAPALLQPPARGPPLPV